MVSGYWLSQMTSTTSPSLSGTRCLPTCGDGIDSVDTSSLLLLLLSLLFLLFLLFFSPSFFSFSSSAARILFPLASEP